VFKLKKEIGMYIKDCNKLRLWIGEGNQSFGYKLVDAFRVLGFSIENSISSSTTYIKINLKKKEVWFEELEFEHFKNNTVDKEDVGICLTDYTHNDLKINSLSYTISLDNKKLKVGCQDITLEDARKIKEFLNKNLAD